MAMKLPSCLGLCLEEVDSRGSTWKIRRSSRPGAPSAWDQSYGKGKLSKHELTQTPVRKQNAAVGREFTL